MGPVFPIVLFVTVLAVVGALAYWAHLAEKKRTEQLSQVAKELGFDFSPRGEPGFLDDLRGHHLFTQGHSRKLTNLMRGKSHDLDVAVFDYRYVTGSGKHRRTWRQTVICIRFEGAELPTFSLRPESVWHKIGSWFGYRDIDFETHPVFSRRYLLRGADEEAIRALFTEDVLAFYQEQSGLSTEGAGNRLLFYRHAARVNPGDVRSLLEEGFKVLSLFRRAA